MGSEFLNFVKSTVRPSTAYPPINPLRFHKKPLQTPQAYWHSVLSTQWTDAPRIDKKYEVRNIWQGWTSSQLPTPNTWNKWLSCCCWTSSQLALQPATLLFKPLNKRTQLMSRWR